MKRSVFLMASLVLFAMSLAIAQEKGTLSSYRVHPVKGKDAALRKAITAHVAKYHTGNWRWRVFSVLSGQDEGAYMINEGPNSWTDLEGRKEISDEHQRDYETTVLPLVEETLPNSYLTFAKELSSAEVGASFKKALLRHFYLKPGKGPRMTSFLTTWKKVFEKLGWNVTVWRSFYSGQPRITVAMRLANGWVDLEKPMGKEMREAFEEFAGTGSYARYLEDLDQIVDRIDEEMIELLPEVSSK